MNYQIIYTEGDAIDQLIQQFGSPQLRQQQQYSYVGCKSCSMRKSDLIASPSYYQPQYAPFNPSASTFTGEFGDRRQPIFSTPSGVQHYMPSRDDLIGQASYFRNNWDNRVVSNRRIEDYIYKQIVHMDDTTGQFATWPNAFRGASDSEVKKALYDPVTYYEDNLAKFDRKNL